MSSGSIPVEAGEILIVEHFVEQRIVPTGTAIDISFGGTVAGALGTGEFSRLDSEGRLPQNKVGRLSGVMLDFFQYAAHSNEGAGLLALRLQKEIYMGAVAEIFVGNVLVCEHPLVCLATPPAATLVGTTTAASAVHQAQNGGWPVAFGEHPITERQSLRVRVRTGAALSGSIAATTFKMSCIWQVKTATMTVGRV